MIWRRKRQLSKETISPTVGTNAVILDPVNRVLLTLRADNRKWCLPGGMLEIGETIEACIRREVFEEINCRIRVGDLVGIYSAPNLKLTPPARSHLVVVCMFAEILDGTPGTSAEVLECAYFYGDNLPTMVPNQSERIQHALHYGKAILL